MAAVIGFDLLGILERNSVASGKNERKVGTTSRFVINFNYFAVSEDSKACGTTTDVNDETVVTYPFILGQYKLALPQVGTFFQFLKTPQGYIVCILIPFLLLILYQGLNCVRIFKAYKKEQMAELQAEKDALEAQKKQSEEMMAQLMAMQQMMMQQQQSAAPPAQPAAAQAAPAEQAQPDMTAMMAELAALRAQLVQQQAEPKQAQTTEEAEPAPKTEENET